MATAPNSDNYTLGRGRLLFNRKVNGAFTGLRDLGNATNFTLSMSTEKLDHYSNRQGIRVKDKSVLTSMAITGSFTLDEIMADNLAMTFLASITDVTQTAEVAVKRASKRLKGCPERRSTAQSTRVPAVMSDRNPRTSMRSTRREL